MTNDELWKLYETILARRERIKDERRARWELEGAAQDASGAVMPAPALTAPR